MTANPVLPLPGNKFYLLVGDGATPTEAFTFFCVGTTVDSKHGAEVEDAWAADCADPTALPTRTSAVKGLTWDLTASGVCDPSKTPYQRVIAAYRGGAALNVQLMRNLPGTSGGNIEQGAFLVTNWTEQKADNGLVKFSCDFHGQGKPTVTANA
ncbi:hypothetical protein FM996_00545 [Methylosinus sporium]|uniref:Phage tail protein n=1 Tax=Methylosinus sporium TaxID=428 RepID=A0A549T910_METSR|nr:phage tail tube protein [Methylosinus sporium]TRL38352.1 hypothetical protein FM996_00545 [Methylosinus sporium]